MSEPDGSLRTRRRSAPTKSSPARLMYRDGRESDADQTIEARESQMQPTSTSTDRTLDRRRRLSLSAGPLGLLFERPMPEGAEDLASGYANLDASNVIYVSTPITTGPELLRWLRANPGASGALRAHARDEVISRNITAVVPLVALVRSRFRDAAIIDPTALEDVQGWTQTDYHRFWSEIIIRYVDGVVFADGWQYSVGCTVEYAAATLLGLPAYNARLERLTAQAGIELLQSTESDLDAVGASKTMQVSAVTTLARLAYSVRVAG